MIARRQFVGAALIAAAALNAKAIAAERGTSEIERRLAAIEKKSGGRLGVAGIDTETGRSFAHRAQERFALCSTFKLLAVGALLARVDRGQENLARRINIEASKLIDNSPITKDHAGGTGMSLAELCAAALDYSDNTAANLILAALGGPRAVTDYARALGDRVTRLDRTEPTLNTAIPGDPRDTTTPAAMAAHLRALVLGKALSRSSRDQLTRWLIANKTGDGRLRAGFPRGWRIGDKTGSGDHGTANDIAIAWPPRRKPIVVAVYLTESAVSPDQQDAAIAEVARAVAATLSP